MASYARDFKEKTNGLLGYLQTQIANFGQWNNIPGRLSKVTASNGNVWGLGLVYNDLWFCQSPCSGTNWVHVEVPNGIPILDIESDDSYVYILNVNSSGESVMSQKRIDNTGNWESVSVPGKAENIFSTKTFMTAKNFITNKSYSCGKPCTTGNWVENPPDALTLLSSDNDRIYAGQYAPDGSWSSFETIGETPATGYRQVPKFKDYGVREKTARNYILNDKSSNLYQCKLPCDNASDIKPYPTNGYTMIGMNHTIASDPTTNKLWMAASSSAAQGNLFERIDNEDPQAIVKESNIIDERRDRDVNALGGEIKTLDAEVRNLEFQKEASDIIRNAVNITPQIQASEEEINRLKSDILQTKSQNSGYTQKLLPLQILTFTLAVVLLAYITIGMFLPSTITSIFAILALSAGLGAAIYFAIKG